MTANKWADPTPSVPFGGLHGSGNDKTQFERIVQLERDLAAAQEALRRANTPIANVTLSGDAQYWQERAQRAEALAESNARDAERYRWLRDRMEVRHEAAMDGTKRPALTMRVGHSFLDSKKDPASGWTSPQFFDESREKLDAAIDAAREGK